MSLKVWHCTLAWTMPDGKIQAEVSTNDNRDLGYPGEHASWSEAWPDLASFARKHPTGSPYTGCLGGEVTIRLDGKLWRGKEDSRNPA